MITSENKIKKDEITFSPSVNIIRDADTLLNYIPTPNGKQVFNQLINDYKTGIRCFNIVGSYGTGKSSFLWAFERSINKKENCFPGSTGLFREIKSFEFLPFIGEYSSIVNTFAQRFGLNKQTNYSTLEIICILDKFYKALGKSGKGLVIVIDEFGKFLEYAATNDPNTELYFIQQLAEYVNDYKKNIFFITTLHQDFNGYARNLTKAQQNEWDKVKGRLKEITFNEPVEQLLYLVSERLGELKLGDKDKNFSKLFTCIETAKAFPLRDYFSELFAERLLPFDILAASILTLALQKYGQNERSLFSFIESNDYLGIKDFNRQKKPYYNISCVYDYLMHSYYSFLTTKYNPHYTQWSAIRTAIERAEGIFQDNINDAAKLVKTIGLLNIFASASAKINSDFLCNYGKYSLGIKEPEKIIQTLEKFKVIRFVKHSCKYILFEGTDLDIELAIDEAGNLVERVSNVVHHLNQYFEFPYIPAKAVYYKNGTPRLFEFHLSEEPAKLSPRGEVDGFINLIFSDNLKEKDIKEESKNCEEAILFGWYRNTNEIKNLLFEIEKVKKVKENNSDDKVAVRELDAILQHQIKLLNHYVLGSIYSDKSAIIWYYKGKKEIITDRKIFNGVLSKICEEVYDKTPKYKNEMVNKTKISSQVATARRNLIRAVVDNWSIKDLGFPDDKFPPEKTIYLSLLRETGTHITANGGYILTEPKEQTFSPLWKAGIKFLEKAKSERRNLLELMEILSSKPFKLKQGFIDFWLPIFLFIKRDDFALFCEGTYIPDINDEVLDLVVRNTKDFEIKTFDIAGVKLDLFYKYRLLLNQAKQEKPSNKSFIETIKPFLTFYRGLPEYAKITRRLSKKTMALREAIANAMDPEKTFFEDFPRALGFNILYLKDTQEELEKYVAQLQNSIREIRGCYEELINRVEDFILEEIIAEKLSFPGYKVQLQERFRKLKKHLLLPHQKVFHQRLISELDDRKSWMSSVAHACIGKSLDSINDEDEVILYEKLRDVIHELDNLCELSKEDIDEAKEDVLKLEVTNFVEGIKKNLIRLPKKKAKELIQLESIIKAKLSKDRQLNVATLTKLLQDQLRDEK